MVCLMSAVHVAILTIPMLRTAAATTEPVDDDDTCNVGGATLTQGASCLQTSKINKEAEPTSCIGLDYRYDDFCSIFDQEICEHRRECSWRFGYCIGLGEKDDPRCRLLEKRDCAERGGECRWRILPSCAGPVRSDCSGQKKQETCENSESCRWGECRALNVTNTDECSDRRFSDCEKLECSPESDGVCRRKVPKCRWGVECNNANIVSVSMTLVQSTDWSLRDSQKVLIHEAHLSPHTPRTRFYAQVCVAESRLLLFEIDGEGKFMINFRGKEVKGKFVKGKKKLVKISVQ